jgi:hypothetical protein
VECGEEDGVNHRWSEVMSNDEEWVIDILANKKRCALDLVV